MAAVKAICPACQAQATAADINIAAMTAVCRACGEVFRLPDLGAIDTAPTRPVEAERPRVVVVEDTLGGGVRLSWGWWRWSYLFLVFFAIAWDGFLVFWYAMAVFGPGPGHSAFSWFAILFPICHVAVGVGLTYFLIAAMLNRTTVELDQSLLTTRVGPVPWLGNRALARERIHRLKVARSETQNRGVSSISYRLLAEMDPDGQVSLTNRFQDREHALYVARTLAALLRVPLGEG